jgi:hypothetical protein
MNYQSANTKHEEDCFQKGNPSFNPKSIKKTEEMSIIEKSIMKKWEGGGKVTTFQSLKCTSFNQKYHYNFFHSIKVATFHQLFT